MEAMELKQAYQEKADAQLRDWQASIEHFKTSPATQGQKNCIDRLNDCQNMARTQLHELSAAQDDRWELVKQAVERAMIELKHIMDEVGVEYAEKRVQLQNNRSYVYAPFSRKG